MPLRLLVICPLLKAITSPTSCGKPRSRRIQALCSLRRHGVHEDAPRLSGGRRVSDGLRGRRYSRSAGPYSSSGARFLGFGARFAGLGSPRSSRAGLFTGGPSTLGKADPTKTFEKRALLSESQKIHHRIYGNDDFDWL